MSKAAKSASLLTRMTISTVMPSAGQGPAAGASSGVGFPPQPAAPTPSSRFFTELEGPDVRAAGKEREIALDLIDTDPSQPRRTFEQEALAELAQTIEATGLIHPPTVRPHPSAPGRYMLVVGERRLRALRLLGRKSAAFRLETALTENQVLIIQLIENSEKARQQVRPFEEAEAIQRLVDMLGGTYIEAARAMGVSKSHITKRLDLLSLPDAVRRLMRENKLGDYEMALSLAKLESVDRASYQGFIAEAERGVPIQRHRVQAALRTAKHTAPGRSGPSPEMKERLAEVKSRWLTALKRAGADAKLQGLDFVVTGTGRQAVRMSVDFAGLAPFEALVAALEESGSTRNP